MDGLFAWLIPPAQAKGRSDYGVRRNAVLSRPGDLLYVGTAISQVVIDEDGEWFIEHTPQGVETIRTDTWDIPASEVTVSPDGRYLVATGTTWTESLSSSTVNPDRVCRSSRWG